MHFVQQLCFSCHIMQTDGLRRWLWGEDMYVCVWQGAFQDSDEACRSRCHFFPVTAQHAGLSPLCAAGMPNQTLVMQIQPECILCSSDNQRVPIHKAEGCIASADWAAEGLDLYRSFQTAAGKCTAGTPAMFVSWLCSCCMCVASPPRYHKAFVLLSVCSIYDRKCQLLCHLLKALVAEP